MMNSWEFTESQLALAIHQWQPNSIVDVIKPTDKFLQLIHDGIQDFLNENSSLYRCERGQKIWRFTENTLIISVNAWVQEAEATNHPKALKLAPIVGKGIAQFFLDSTALYYGSLPEAHTQTESPTVNTDNYGDPNVLQTLFYNDFDQLT